MNSLRLVLAALVLTPLIDQGMKYAIRRALGDRSVPLGRFGRFGIVQSRMWSLRMQPALSLRAVWLRWTMSAGAAGVAVALFPPLTWALALLVGAALSHAIETSWRGSVCDYVCLRFWPAFNLADVALTIGAGGVVYELLRGV